VPDDAKSIQAPGAPQAPGLPPAEAMPGAPITASAWRNRDGSMLTGPSHLRALLDTGRPEDSFTDDIVHNRMVDGFLDANGQFVDGEEAYRRAEANGQIDPAARGRIPANYKGRLASEWLQKPDDGQTDMFGAPPAPKAPELGAAVLPAPKGPVPAFTPADAEAPPRVGQPAGVFTFDAASLKTDPARFQYKADTDEEGVNVRLKGVTKWDQAKAGQIVAYEDKDGQVYVADGHQRTGLARRLKAQDPNAQTPVTGILYRHADGFTPQEVMALAAAKNLAEGSGSTVDAAKILRSYPQLLDGSVSMSDAKVQQAKALASLGDDAWRMVTNAKVDPLHAAEVGRLIPEDHERQMAAMDLLSRAEPSSIAEAESLVRQVRDSDIAPAAGGGMDDMFKTFKQSLAIEKSKVMAAAARVLATDKKVFGTLVKEADRIAGVGNKLKSKTNQALAQDAGSLMEQINKLAYRTGPVSDALKVAAQALKDGTPTAKVARAFLEDVRKLSIAGKAQPFAPEVLQRGRSGIPLRRAPLGNTDALIAGVQTAGERMRPPERPAYPERLPGEDDKTFAKRAIDTQGEVDYLPEAHDRYFNTEGAETVPLENLHSTKSAEDNQQGGDNGAKRMLAAWHGLLSGRDPITVMPSVDRPGHYDVVDGNGTTTSAKRLGWKSLPVKVVDRKTGTAMINADRAKEAKKAGQPAPAPYHETTAEPPPPEHWAAVRDVERLMKAEHDELVKAGLRPEEPEEPNHIPAAGMDGVGSLALQRARVQWRREPTKDEPPVAGKGKAKATVSDWQAASPHETIPELFRNARMNQARLGYWGREIKDRLVKAGILKPDAFSDPGIKGMKRTLEKFEEKYGSKGMKAGYLTDIIRAGFKVERPQDGDLVARELARHYPVADEGWVMTPAGYFDRKLMIKFPDGTIGEVQLWERGLLDAKQAQGGHALYEEWRSPETSHWRKMELEAQMRTLYGRAYGKLNPEWKEAVPAPADLQVPPAATKGRSTEGSGEGTENRSPNRSGDKMPAMGDTSRAGNQASLGADQTRITGGTSEPGSDARITGVESSEKNSNRISGTDRPPSEMVVRDGRLVRNENAASNVANGERQAMSRRKPVNASPRATQAVQNAIQAKINAAASGPAAAPGGGGGGGRPPGGAPPASPAPAAPNVPPARRGLAQIYGYVHEKVAAMARHLGLDELGHQLQMLATPMASMRASDEARATAKDFANALRLADWQWGRMSDILKRDFKPDRLAAMWEAADEESVMLQTGETPSGVKLAGMPPDQRKQYGLGRLSKEERDVVEYLQDRADQAWERAKAAGLVDPAAAGLPSYVPRMVVMMAPDGTVSHVVGTTDRQGKPLDGRLGQNLSTSTNQLKHRGHLTAGDTEAAAKAAFGANAAVVRDIRSLALATSHLEKAIAGRTLVNAIKAVGQQTGGNTVHVGGAPAHGWFTIDNPALKRWAPQFETDPVTGKTTPRLDAAGQPIMHQVPIYIRGDFEGPLRAVLSRAEPKWAQGLMGLKSRAMMAIMYSPLIHNAVEFGRAMPAMPGKVLTFRVYFEGNAAKSDPATMREAISAGLVPIGKRAGVQDITSVLNNDDIAPGRSLLAKGLGKAGDAMGLDGNKARRAVDKAGDVWHNTLLWDRVGDLQMGLYSNFRDKLIRHGADPLSAQRIAAHLANRYAGALPKESMSQVAARTANLALFSRSFTLGNIGAMKDSLTGLPRDVRAQILRDNGQGGLGMAKSMARRKAIATLALDVGLMYGMNSLLQSMANTVLLNGSLEEELEGYARRFKDELARVENNPLNLLGSLGRLSATADNEPGKEDRILVGKQKDGTGIYARNPVGKIGEEMLGWSTTPIDMVRRKLSTFARPIYQMLSNNTGFDRHLYDPHPHTPMDWIKNVGRIAWAFVGAQVPGDSITAAGRLATGQAQPMDPYKVIGPLAGVTFSKGAPGGPAVGEMWAAEDAKRERVNRAMPDIRDLIRAGKEDEARQRMDELGMSPKSQANVFKTTENPGSRLSPGNVRKLQKDGSDEQIDRFERARERWDRVPTPAQ
jgi:hypothetical protein